MCKIYRDMVSGGEGGVKLKEWWEMGENDILQVCVGRRGAVES